MKTEDQTVAEAMQYYYDRNKEELEFLIRRMYRQINEQVKKDDNLGGQVDFTKMGFDDETY